MDEPQPRHDRLARRLGMTDAVFIGLGSMIGAGDSESDQQTRPGCLRGGLESGEDAGAVVAMTAVNYRGVRKTAQLTRLILAVVLGSLTAVIVASVFGGSAQVHDLSGLVGHGWLGVLRSAGLLFFAFAGYARIATLGEEVRDPARTIPRAIPLALGITLVVYVLVAASALAAVRPRALASAHAPLVAAVRAGSMSWASPLVVVGAAAASLGVLLSLLAGVSRTTYAMARDRELPRALDAVHDRYRTPHRAELAVGLIVVVVLLSVDLREAIGFSSFTILVYYAIANAAAWTQTSDHRRWPRALQVVGLIGCGVLAFTLPLSSIAIGAGVLAIGALIHAARLRVA